MTVPYRALGRVRNIFQATGLEISYAYDDLMFSDNSVFIVRFDENVENMLHLYFNEDCEKSEAERIEQIFMKASKNEGFSIGIKGLFSLQQSDGSEEISIKFKEGC